MKNIAFLPEDTGKISDLNVICYLVPTDEPESDGTLEWDKTIMVTVRVTSGDTTGFGYSYAGLPAARFINDNFKDLVTGKNVFANIAIWDEMKQKARNMGAEGVASMAISAVDIALWDLKAKILGIPLAYLLGLKKDRVAVYGSGGFTSYTDNRLKKQFDKWTDLGISMFKMKIGRDKEKDEERIKYARNVIGAKNSLFIDANGAYYPQEAIKYSRVFEKYDINWFEEPVSSDDLSGMAFVHEHIPPGMNIAAGEYGYTGYYFNRMLSSGAVDILQADATCCGGITGFLKAAALAEAYHTPFSAHTAPTVHIHACCSWAGAINIEYFHDHARIEEMFFDGFICPAGGFLAPDPDRPGLGIEFKEKVADKFLIS